MENTKTHHEIRCVYQRIFGVPSDSFSGPLFFFFFGIISLIISILIMIFIGAFSPGVLGEYPYNSARPDITFPFLNILTVFFISAGIVGIFLGGLGIVWYCLLLRNKQ